MAKNYDYFYKEANEAEANVLLKYFNVQPHHIVVDIGSGTGFLAERLYERSELKNPVWCVDPSAEMQEEAKKKKGLFPIQKPADEFLDELALDQCFDRAMCIATPHHFADAVKIYRGVESILSPGGVFLVMEARGFIFPWFTKVENRMGAFFGERKEITSACLRLTKFDVDVKEENIEFKVTKSKWYHMLRGRFNSNVKELTDEEIEEGIDELERGKLKDLKPQDNISISGTLLVFIARKKSNSEVNVWQINQYLG